MPVFLIINWFLFSLLSLAIVVLIALNVIGTHCTPLLFIDKSIRNTKGQPGCKTSIELKVKLFQYHDEPRLFWECDQYRVDAKCQQCPENKLFNVYMRECVPVENYDWHPNVRPPSAPDHISTDCKPPKFTRILSNKEFNGFELVLHDDNDNVLR